MRLDEEAGDRNLFPRRVVRNILNEINRDIEMWNLEEEVK